MATLRNKRKLAAANKETQEEHPRNGQSRNTSIPRINAEYITQVSKEIENRVTEKLSQELSRIESRILLALSKLDEFLLNPQIQTQSGTVPGTFRNTNVENQEPNEDRSQDDPHPEVGPSICHSHHSIDSDTDEAPHMVTKVQEEIRYLPHMVTEIEENIPYCSPGTSSGKQKKARSTNQPSFHSENTPATFKADQISLALQKLASNSNSANINNNINKVSKLPQSLNTTKPTFEGKSEKFELFEDLFQTSLKVHNQLTEDKMNYFHTLMRGDWLQTARNNSSRNRENLAEILTVSRRKDVKTQSMATAKYKFQHLDFNPANQKLIDFLDDLQKLAENALGAAAQAIIEQVVYAKLPPHLNKSINRAHLQNGTYEQTVTHIERELELSSLESPEKTQMISVTHKQQIEGNQDNAGNINSDTNDTNPNNIKNDRKSRTVYPPRETCGKTNHSAERSYVGANAANRPLLWKSKPQQQDAQASIAGCVWATSLTSKVQMLCRHVGTVSDSGNHWNNTSTNLKCCLAATLGNISGKYKLANIHSDSTTETIENNQRPQLKQRNDIESQTSPLKETSL